MEKKCKARHKFNIAASSKSIENQAVVYDFMFSRKCAVAQEFSEIFQAPTYEKVGLNFRFNPGIEHLQSFKGLIIILKKNYFLKK